MGLAEESPNGVSSSRKQEGFVLVWVAAGLAFIFGGMGLVLDLGRLYIAKTELQRFCDHAALAAAYELNGSSSGITEAASRITSLGTGAGKNAWDFDSKVVTGAQVAFATTLNGSYSSSPASAANVKFARVSVSQSVSYFLAPLIPSVPSSGTVNASAIAGQMEKTSLGDGLAPFSPDAHNPSDANFGFTAGSMYDLKWAPPGQRKKSGGTCAGDSGFTPAGGSSDRGFIDVGQGSGNSNLNDVIVDNNYYLSSPLTYNSTITMVTGNKSVGGAMNTRFLQDTDTSSTDYAHYTSNGRRILIVPVNNHSDPPAVAGFASFLINHNACGTKNTDPCCAQYVGAALVPNAKAGATTGGLYEVALFR
jgi:Flp pilus assembly protein TadG